MQLQEAMAIKAELEQALPAGYAVRHNPDLDNQVEVWSHQKGADAYGRPLYENKWGRIQTDAEGFYFVQEQWGELLTLDDRASAVFALAEYVRENGTV